MKKHIEQYPVPDNLSCVPTMDANLKATIRKEGKNTSSAVDLDEDWASIQSKIQDIMGPIGVAWGTLQCHTNLFPPGSSKEDPGSLQNYLPNICHDLRQII